MKCCEKFLKHSQRVGLRFAELNAGAEEQMQEMLRQQQGEEKTLLKQADRINQKLKQLFKSLKV